MLWKKFNDQVALFVLCLFILVWISDVVMRGLGFAGFAEGVMGATISLVTLIVQYYFRQRPPEEPPNGGAK